MPTSAPGGPARLSRPVSMALNVLGVGTLLAVVLAISGLMEPWQLLAAGETGPSRGIVERDFPDVELVDDVGFDGQQFYAIAAELPDLHAAAQHLDDPRYRLLRILGPLVASIAPAGAATVWILLELNILGAALAVGGLASLCAQTGRSAGLGWLALVPIGPAMFLTVIDPLATGLTFAALALLLREQVWAATAIFAIGCLTREGIAAIVAASALSLLIATRRIRPALTLSLAVVPLVGWYVYLADEIGGEIPNRWKVLGFLHVGPGVGALAVMCLALGCLAVWGWRSTPAVAAAAAVITIQIPFFFEDILLPFSITRVTALALSLGLVVITSRAGQQRPSPAADHASA